METVDAAVLICLLVSHHHRPWYHHHGLWHKHFLGVQLSTVCVSTGQEVISLWGGIQSVFVFICCRMEINNVGRWATPAKMGHSELVAFVVCILIPPLASGLG